MKKKNARFYFLIPIVALAAFIPFEWHFSANYEQIQEQRAAQTRQDKIAKIAEQDRQRQKAIEEAVATQAKRAKEKKEREARLQKEKDDREAAMQARNKAINETSRLKDQLDHIQKDVATVKEDIAKIQADERKQRQESVFAQKYVLQAEANVKKLSQVLDQIAAADAAAEAASAAAAAKKS